MDLKNIFTSPTNQMHRRKFGMMEKMMHRRKILRRKTNGKQKPQNTKISSESENVHHTKNYSSCFHKQP